MLSIDSADAVDGPRPAAEECQPTPKETTMSIILSAILLISYAGLLAIALILAASIDNDDHE